jgi:hypothetical protein
MVVNNLYKASVLGDTTAWGSICALTYSQNMSWRRSAGGDIGRSCGFNRRLKSTCVMNSLLPIAKASIIASNRLWINWRTDCTKLPCEWLAILSCLRQRLIVDCPWTWIIQDHTLPFHCSIWTSLQP